MEAVVVIALYFLPTIVAIVRKHRSAGSIAVINFFLGWTIIGWIIALSMAAGSARGNGQTIVIRNENVIGDGNSIRRSWESDLEEEAPRQPSKIRSAFEDRVASGLKPVATTHANGSSPASSNGRRCPAGHAVASLAQFCSECGVAMVRKCENGHPVTSDGRFCMQCGGRVAADVPAGGH